MTTIDILEECLDTIYRVRKASLEYRSRKLKAVTISSKDSVASIDTRKSDSKSVSNTRLAQRLTGKIIDEDLDEDDDDDIIENKNANKLSVPTAPQKSPAKSYVQVVETTEAFKLVDAQKHDFEATNAFSDFCRELDTWWSDNFSKREDDEAREMCADYLSDKYMCQRLDPLPPSKVVTQVRKNMSRIIDDFAVDGNLPPEVGLYRPPNKGVQLSPEKLIETAKTAKQQQQQHVVSPSSSSVAVQPNKQVSNNSNNSSSSNKNSQGIVECKTAVSTLSVAATASKNIEAIQAAKRESEKQKIKNQYESYMKTKDKTESHPDNSKAKQYEDNVDEIKNLIANLRSK
eukprot:gene660-1272_t